ncbi:MAG: hypothetical protein IJ689_04785 [Alphaproteobacteria bacterium]|nr:hypothetical protein [Alphaproteobacteria bacterium]
MEKNIFIITQAGVKPEYMQAMRDGVREFMDMFPEYKDDYPIRLLGRWESSRSTIGGGEYLRIPPQKRKLCVPMSDGRYMLPFESSDWAFAMAKYSALANGRPEQINASMLLDLMDADPTVRDIPQIDLHLAKDDAFAMTPHGPTNFVYGLGSQDRGMVLSVCRYEKMYKNNPAYLREVIKTITIHELGHIFAATQKGRHNVANRDGYGYHCDCPGCVMRTDTKAKSNELTNDRLARRQRGEPPLCPECIAMARVHFSQVRGNREDMQKAADVFNRIRRQARDYF